jgi:hypothetical protein
VRQKTAAVSLSADALLRLPVRLRGIAIGRPVDVILDLGGRRALGLDLLCRDETHRFLPLSAASVGDDEIAVSSALTLLSADELAFYRRQARTLRDMRGARVRRGTRDVGRLQDVLIGSDGEITDVVVDGGRRVPLGEAVDVSVDPARVDAA